MEIAIKDLQKKVELNPPQILKILKAILRHEGIDKVFLSIVFVNQKRIKVLNEKFLNRNYTTDVLAFDLTDNETKKQKLRQKPRTIMGDIIISTDAALKNAKMYQTTLPEELTLYMIHGILHLLGFDDHEPEDIKKMRKKEQKILDYLGGKISTVVSDKV